jgi:hypothetical protein
MSKEVLRLTETEKKDITVLVPPHVMERGGETEKTIRIIFNEKDKSWELYKTNNITELEVQAILENFHCFSRAVNYNNMLSTDDPDPGGVAEKRRERIEYDKSYQ